MNPEQTKSQSRWRIWLIPVLLIIAIVLVAAWAVTRRDSKALASVDIGNGVRLELVAALTKVQPKVDLSPASRTVFNKIPRPVQRFFAFFRPPQSQVVQSDDLGETDTTLVFVPRSSEGVAKPKHELQRAVNEAAFAWIRFNYGDGFYSETVRLEFDYTNGGGEKPIWKATVKTIPAIPDQLKLEFVKVGSTWSYGAAHKSGELVTSTNVKNPVHRQVTPLTNPVALPAVVNHEDVTVALQSLASGYSPEPALNAQRPGTGLHIGRQTFQPSEGTGTDPHFLIATVQLDQEGTTTPEWGFDNIKTFYGTSEIPFVDTGRLYLQREGPMAYVFTNDVGVLKQPVLIKIELIHRDNFGPGETLTVDLPVPADGKIVPPDSGAKLKFWDQDVTVVGASLNTRIPLKDMEVGSDEGLTIALKSEKAVPQIRSARLLRKDGESIDITKYGRTSGTSGGSSGNFSYRAFEVEKAVGEIGSGNLEDYTTITVQVVSPKMFPKTFDFVVEPTKI